ncbi:DUF479 domain-containing protein [Aliiglaciecola sp. M165]|nr:DUF479 domain-containing protein [Aliiglaciecola sp. M165]
MNYVAHIHLAHVSKTSLLGNFMGDFVKGQAYRSLPDELSRGVQLHRKIDTFTDQHSSVLRLKRNFPDNIRRMSGVVLDIYFDHLLCRYWEKYSENSLEQVLDRFYQELEHSTTQLSGRYSQVKQGLLEHRWLVTYQNLENCLEIFFNIEKRLSRQVSFAEQSYQYLLANQADIEEHFLSFYPELVGYTHSITHSNV